ncbi:unnamed protein product [Heligmosomoides polygyrus]|uniref:Uncharacterized protein n=1 Tax=Heligmosomoides polygyrus TaxID=6339 RepID=A0A183F7F8_HELPZ|nr:unnamed protein product [Heligmosomoides polygyrus]
MTCHQCSEKDAQVEKRCHRCRARVPNSHAVSTMSCKALQSTSGLRRHVIDITHQVPGFRRGATDIAKGLPDSDDVSPMSRKARSG